MGLDNQGNIKPAFDNAKDCFYAPGVDLSKGYVRETYSSNITKQGPISDILAMTSGKPSVEDSSSVQQSYSVCQPVTPELENSIANTLRRPALTPSR